MTRPFATILLAAVLTAACTPVLAQAPSPKFVYVANVGDGVGGQGSVSAYTVNPTTGGLTPIPGSPFAAGSYSQSLAVDSSGQFVYVANYGARNISAFTINATSGALTLIDGSPFPAGAGPRSVTVDPTDQFVYAPDYYSGVWAYTIDAITGALTPVDGSPFGVFGPLSAITGPHGPVSLLTHLMHAHDPPAGISAT